MYKDIKNEKSNTTWHIYRSLSIMFANIDARKFHTMYNFPLIRLMFLRNVTACPFPEHELINQRQGNHKNFRIMCGQSAIRFMRYELRTKYKKILLYFYCKLDARL